MVHSVTRLRHLGISVVIHHFFGDITTKQNFRIHFLVNPSHSAKPDKKARQYKRVSRGTKGIYWVLALSQQIKKVSDILTFFRDFAIIQSLGSDLQAAKSYCGIQGDVH